MDNKLTAKMLDELKPGIFVEGFTIDDPDHIYLAGTGNLIKWVAVRGTIADWAIYTENPFDAFITFAQVRDWGHKLHNREYIKKLVDCDDEALERYRD